MDPGCKQEIALSKDTQEEIEHLEYSNERRAPSAFVASVAHNATKQIYNNTNARGLGYMLNQKDHNHQCVEKLDDRSLFIEGGNVELSC